MSRWQIPYDESRHVGTMPGPLNGPSAALGTPEMLDRLVRRLDPIDQDVIEIHARQGVRQKALAALLDVTTQSGISMRLARARECLRHLAREPVPVEEALAELVLLVPPALAGPVVTWAAGTCSASRAMIRHGARADNYADTAALSNLMYKALRRLSGASDRLRAWLDWRTAMPRRYDMSSLRGRTRPSSLPTRPTPAQVAVLERWPLREAARMLGISHSLATRLWRAAGRPRVDPRDEVFASVAHLPTVLASRRIGVSPASIRRWRELRGLPRVPQSHPRHRISGDELRRRLAPVEGLGPSEAGRRLGVSPCTVGRWRSLAAKR